MLRALSGRATHSIVRGSFYNASIAEWGESRLAFTGPSCEGSRDSWGCPIESDQVPTGASIFSIEPRLAPAFQASRGWERSGVPRRG